jgi:hypothetical protein
MDIAVSASMKLVDSDGTLSRDMDAPENDRASLTILGVNQFFKLRAIRSAMP